MRTLLVVLAVAWSLLLIAWLTLHWGILPHIQQWRGPIEERAGRALGVPVRIGQIEVRSSGWVPSFELREVLLMGADGRPALRLPRVFAAISPRSLLSLELGFEQLLIDGAELELRRDASGRIFVAGLDFSGPGDGEDGAAADWFFKQREFVVRGGSLRWTDELRNAPPLALTDVQLVVRNSLREHSLRLDATPPAEWGERFSASGNFKQPLLARRGDWRLWSGNAFASLPRADVRELRRHVALPFELSEGSGALRGWFEIKDGEPIGATVDLALREVELRLDKRVDALDFEQVEGRLIGQRSKEGVTLEVQRFSFRTGDGIRWPEGDMKLAWRQRAGEPSTGGAFSAQRLDVGLMAQIATRIPLGDALRRLLDELHPQGAISDLDAHWDGELDAPAHYKVTGKLAGLALAAKPSAEGGGIGRPGFRNANLQLDATETGGTARIEIGNGALDLPGVFEDPLLQLDQLSAQLLWKIEPQTVSSRAKGPALPAPSKVTVQLKDVRLANADARAELGARWSTGAGPGVARGGRYPGRLELDGKLLDGVATRIYRYLPLGISGGTRGYVERAVQGGRLNASFHVKGDLWDFPFYNAKKSDGEFRILAKADDVGFAYVPGPSGAPPPWPALARASAELALDRGTLEIRNGKARIGNIEWDKVSGGIRHLDTEGELALDAHARGPLSEMLRYVNVTPVGGWIGKVLDNSTGAGNAELSLKLDLPLLHIDTGTTVAGNLQLAGNDIRITPGSPLLGNATGRVEFTNKSFAVVGAGAKLYGGDAKFQGGMQPDGSLRFNGEGTASADGLRRSTELGQLSRIAASLAGQTNYRMNLAFVHGEPELTVTSNLAGLAINLPPPLNKPAEMVMAMRYQNAGDPQPAGAAPRDLLQFELGNVIQARFARDLSVEPARVLRGGIGVFEPAPTPATGVAASLTLKALDVDAWQTAADKLFGASESREASGKASYQPDTISLRAQDISAGARRLTHLTAKLTQDSGTWHAELDADQLAGTVNYRAPSRRGAAASGSRVEARLSRLSVPKSDVEQVESLLDAQPSSVPELDIVVDDFELRGKRLGRLEVLAANRTGPFREALRDWQLSKFNITTPEAQLTATGHWAATGAPPLVRGGSTPRRATLDFKLQVSDSGALLDRLGEPKAIRGGKGQLSGQVAWLGSPFSLDYPSLAGQVNVAVDAGQFLKVEPGAARLLGVLSLQSLPRRLSLDFRDLFQEGFAFDNITGDIKIAQGVAQSNNLRMRGVQAVVLMEGSADLERETQDLRVVVVPEISAGTAALAYAVINPALGLGAFLAQAILKKPLTAAGTREFRISGNWSDPQVAPVKRKITDEVPATDAAASVPPKNP